MRTKTLAVLLILAAIFLANISSPLTARAAEPTSTVLAKGTIAKLPDGDFIFRVVDLKLAPGDNAVSHKHGAGMLYAIDGPNELTVDNKTTTLNPGQAAWIDDQVQHTHASDGKTEIHFLFMYLWPGAKKGAPMAPGFREASVAFESTPLTFNNRNGQDVELSDTIFETAQAIDIKPINGPRMLNIQEGTFAVEIGKVSLTMQKGDYLSVPPDTAIHIVSKLAGHALILSVIPTS